MRKGEVSEGKWGRCALAPPGISQPKGVPNYVWASFGLGDPDWDWFYAGEGYFIARMYDEGVETERVLCKVIGRRVVKRHE